MLHSQNTDQSKKVSEALAKYNSALAELCEVLVENDLDLQGAPESLTLENIEDYTYQVQSFTEETLEEIIG